MGFVVVVDVGLLLVVVVVDVEVLLGVDVVVELDPVDDDVVARQRNNSNSAAAPPMDRCQGQVQDSLVGKLICR